MKVIWPLITFCVAVVFYHAGNRFRLSRINLKSYKEIKKRLVKYKNEIGVLQAAGNTLEIEKITSRIDELKWVIENHEQQ